MQKYILSLLLIISNLATLNAKESPKIGVKVFCSNSKVQKLSIKIDSNRLNLTQDAVQDNLGGYVDIPEDSYYLKTSDKLYRLKGIVEKNHIEDINQFIAYIDNYSKEFITINELNALKNSKDLKIIQKINLENDKQNNTATNILYIYFDESLFNREYSKCKK